MLRGFLLDNLIVKLWLVWLTIDCGLSVGCLLFCLTLLRLFYCFLLIVCRLWSLLYFVLCVCIMLAFWLLGGYLLFMLLCGLIDFGRLFWIWFAFCCLRLVVLLECFSCFIVLCLVMVFWRNWCVTWCELVCLVFVV